MTMHSGSWGVGCSRVFVEDAAIYYAMMNVSSGSRRPQNTLRLFAPVSLKAFVELGQNMDKRLTLFDNTFTD